MSAIANINFQEQYYKNYKNKKIVIIGILPAPLGGIAIHIQRVAQAYKEQQNTVRIFDVSKKRWYKFLFYDFVKLLFSIIFFLPHKIDYHVSYTRRSLLELFVLSILSFFLRFKINIVDHDCRYLYSRSWFYKKLNNIVLRLVHTQVIIGTSTYKSYCDTATYLKNYTIESAFVAPDVTLEKAILNTYPKSLNEFLKTHKPVICANAFDILLHNNQDLYGIDNCIELIRKIKQNFRNAGLVIAFAQISDKKYFQYIKLLVEAYHLEDSVYFLINNYEFWPLIKQTDLFVRPTLSDSFGISVAEAIFLNVPVVASDVCARPEGTMCYKSGDFEDLYQNVYKVLNANSEKYYCWADQQNSANKIIG